MRSVGLTVERIIAAPPERVWAAWMTEQGLAGWWWKHLPGTTFAVDPRAGGRYRISSPTAGIGVRGEFLEVDEPKRFLATWIWLDDGVEGTLEHIDVTLVEHPQGTQLRIVHSGPWTSDEPVTAYVQGWNDTLLALDELFR